MWGGSCILALRSAADGRGLVFRAAVLYRVVGQNSRPPDCRSPHDGRIMGKSEQLVSRAGIYDGLALAVYQQDHPVQHRKGDPIVEALSPLVA